MIFVNIQSELIDNLQPGPFERAAMVVLCILDPSKEVDLTLVITDDAQVQELNQKYRGIDAPTDVLSFPSGEVDLDTGHTYLGDVIISYPQAYNQSELAGHPVESELQLLTIHGVLHLLGYDHAEPQEKSRMWAAQTAALTTLGLAGIKILEE
jgi:probable rRNA maturation factor